MKINRRGFAPALLVAVLLAAASPEPARAMEEDGIVFWGGLSTDQQSDGMVHLRFQLQAEGDSTRQAWAHLELDPALRLFAGDTAVSARGGGAPAAWECVLQGEPGHKYTIAAIAWEQFDALQSESTRLKLVVSVDSNGKPSSNTTLEWDHWRIGSQLYGRESGHPVLIENADTLGLALAARDRPGPCWVDTTGLPHVIAEHSAEFPESARAAGVSGTVLLGALVGIDGQVKAVRVYRSVAGLDSAATVALKLWKFTPAVVDGRPKEVWFAVPFKFTLK